MGCRKSVTGPPPQLKRCTEMAGKRKIPEAFFVFNAIPWQLISSENLASEVKTCLGFPKVILKWVQLNRGIPSYDGAN